MGEEILKGIVGHERGQEVLGAGGERVTFKGTENGRKIGDTNGKQKDSQEILRLERKREVPGRL